MNKKIYLVALIVFVIDQITKLIITSNLKLHESIEIIKNFFSISYVQNTGGAWGLFGGSSLILIFITIIFLVAFFYFLNKEKNISTLNSITYGLLLSGVLGNLFDRIIHGYVIDFFDFYIFGYNFPVFNIADICIVISVALLIIEVFRGGINERNSK